MATTTATTGAYQLVKEQLDEVGLGALAQWAWAKVQNGEDWSQIHLEMRDTPEFKARFPAFATLAKEGRFTSGNPEAEYLAIENSYRDTLHAYGLPSGFYDTPDAFGKLMVGGVSPSELNDRIKTYTAAVTGDTETLTQLRTLYDSYGHDNSVTGDLLAHYLDPNAAAPVLHEQLQAAQFASAGVRSGFGQVSRAEAEQFGAQAGTSQQQAEQGFSTLYNARQLMQGLPGENQDQIGSDVQLGAMFGGNAADAEQIANRARLRVAEGSGGGGFTTTRTGVSGLSSNET